MTAGSGTVLLYTLFPSLGMITGGVIAAFYQPSSRLTSATQHLAAGVVFAAVAIELLPKLETKIDPTAIIIGFSIGVISMLLLKFLTEKLASEDTKNQGISLGLISAIGIDLFIDGVLIGIAFLAGTAGGLLIAFALGIEILFLGLSTSATLGQQKMPLKTTLSLIFGLTLLIPLGSLTGFKLLSILPDVVTKGFLAFGVAALLYLVTEELLSEAHESEIEPPLVTGCFFVGFLGILMMAGLTGQ